MHLSDLIHVYPEAVSADNCNDIIEAVNSIPNAGKLYDNDLYKFEQVNINQTIPELANEFASVVAGYATNYFKTLGVDRYIGLQSFEEVRVKKYIKGDGEFRPHIDVDNLDSAKRYLVAILYLNDNNGVTDFPALGLSVPPKAGTLVMFPPMWMFPHSGTRPTDRDKYIMMTSLTYV